MLRGPEAGRQTLIPRCTQADHRPRGFRFQQRVRFTQVFRVILRIVDALRRAPAAGNLFCKISFHVLRLPLREPLDVHPGERCSAPLPPLLLRFEFVKRHVELLAEMGFVADDAENVHRERQEALRLRVRQLQAPPFRDLP